MARVLRPYQLDALAGIRAALESHASAVCVLPTGTGKTSVASTLMNDWPGGNCLFLAHTRELVDQAAARLAGELGYPPVVEMGPAAASGTCSTRAGWSWSLRCSRCSPTAGSRSTSGTRST